MEKNTMKKRKLTIEEGLYLLLAGTALLALILYVSFCLDNLMHSDTTAEVILSKFLADRNELISKEWFYSTEIRVIYTQLVMVPLFKIFSSYRLVKLLSVFIYYAVLLYAWHMLTKRFTLEKKWIFLGLALLLAPLSNEYLDMMFIDEGFGTLDAQSRKQAIEVLSQLAGSERLVGIISHVTELKEQIEHRLYVTRTENGSEAVWEE